MKNSVFILWLEGVNPARLSEVPSLSTLAKEGVDIQLAPSPLAEKKVCYYQTLTGMGSGKFGRFDAVRPEKYSVLEDASMPEGAIGRLLPDVLRSRKLSTTFLEAKELTELEPLSNQAYDCLIVRFAAGNLDAVSIDALVQRCSTLVPSEGHLLVLTDVWCQESATFVNINDFLVDIGLLEVKEPRQQSTIVWPETLAFGLGTGQLWINLQGREVQGNVRSGNEYQQVRDVLINELTNNWRDPQTGSSIVEQVLKKEEAYSGAYLFNAPDLVVVYRPGYAPSPKAVALDFDGVSVSNSESESITPAIAPMARLIGSGPHLAHGLTEKAALVDVMPSVMYLLEQPIIMDVDGNVISSMFTPAYLQQTPIHRIDSDDDLLSDEEEGMIVDRLRDLGYLG
jgi:hypothetical protein